MVFLFSSVVSAAVSSDNEVYLRRDVFEAKNEKFRQEMCEMNADTRAEMKEGFAKINTEIQVMNSKIKAIDTRIGDFKPEISEAVKGLRRPQITLEDVKKLIEENNAILLQKLAPPLN